MNNTTQREFIIKKLQDAGVCGVSSYEFTFDHHIKQCPTRVHELRKLGFNIISKPFRNSVIYVLSTLPKTAEVISMPTEVKPWEKPLVRVEKNGRVFWEEVTEAKQLSI